MSFLHAKRRWWSLAPWALVYFLEGKERESNVVLPQWGIPAPFPSVLSPWPCLLRLGPQIGGDNHGRGVSQAHNHSFGFTLYTLLLLLLPPSHFLSNPAVLTCPGFSFAPQSCFDPFWLGRAIPEGNNLTRSLMWPSTVVYYTFGLR